MNPQTLQQQMTIQQFGQSVQAKYPQYKDMSPEEVGKKVLAKYPVYQSRVKAEAPPTVTERIVNTGDRAAKAVHGTAGNLAVGAAKGVANTVATVPSSVGKVAGRAMNIGTQNIYSEVTQKNADTKMKVIEQMRKLPPDSPRLKVYQDILNDIATDEEINRTDAMSAAEQAVSFAEKPEWTKPEGTAQKIGYGAEKLGEFIVGSKGIVGPTTTAGKGATAMQKVANIGIQSGKEGVAAGAVTAAQGGDMNDVAKATMLSTLLSVPFKAVSEISGGAAGYLKESAKNDVAKALKPTTKGNKAITEKIAPQMLDRKVRFFTRSGLEKKAAAEADTVGEKINEAWSALPPNTKATITPFVDDLQRLKDDLTITLKDGSKRVPESAAARYAALQNIQDEVLSFASAEGDDAASVSAETLRKWKQIQDGILKARGKGFGLTGSESDKLFAQKEGTNAIRGILNSENPNIAKLNKEFSFWKNVEQVVGDTVKRTAGQSSLGEDIAETGGLIYGGLKGGPFAKVILTATGLRFLKRLVTSPAWKMTTGILKNQIADSLMSGKAADFTRLANQVLNASVSSPGHRP